MASNMEVEGQQQQQQQQPQVFVHPVRPTIEMTVVDPRSYSTTHHANIAVVFSFVRLFVFSFFLSFFVFAAGYCPHE
jgi:hypothetical protein